MKYDKNTETIQRRGTFGLDLVGARALCPDGKVRPVKVTGVARDFDATPARAKYRGKTVSGFISFNHEYDKENKRVEWVDFTPTGKHSNAFT